MIRGMRTVIAIVLASMTAGAAVRLKPDATYGQVRLKPDTTSVRGVRLSASAPTPFSGASARPRRSASREGGQADHNVERGILRLHYVQKPIGYERYEIVRDGDDLKLTSDFDFTDRGGRVQLAATLSTKADFTPLAFKATGKSYRFVNVDSDVRIDGGDAIVRADGHDARVALTAPFYTVDGYAPFPAQR